MIAMTIEMEGVLPDYHDTPIGPDVDYAPAIERLSNEAVDTIAVDTIAVDTIAVDTIAFEALHPFVGFFIFPQERIGQGETPFSMYKFRTMHHGAEAFENGYQRDARGKIIDDTRYTRIGKWLKRRRIDEIPQLFNVMRGEMALVGPRPHKPDFLETYVPEESIERRQSVKPGIFKPLTAFSDFDYGGLEFRCDDQFIFDNGEHPRTNVARYLSRALAPQRFKRVLDPSLPRYSSKDFFTPRFPVDGTVE